MKMITRKTAVTVVPKGKPIFSIAGISSGWLARKDFMDTIEQEETATQKKSNETGRIR